MRRLTDEVDLDDSLHLVSGVVDEGPAVEDAGVVDQDVDVADGRLDLFRHLAGTNEKMTVRQLSAGKLNNTNAQAFGASEN